MPNEIQVTRYEVCPPALQQARDSQLHAEAIYNETQREYIYQRDLGLNDTRFLLSRQRFTEAREAQDLARTRTAEEYQNARTAVNAHPDENVFFITREEMRARQITTPRQGDLVTPAPESIPAPVIFSPLTATEEPENFICNCCSGAHPTDERTTAQDGDEICDTCRDDNYCLCENCSEIVHHEHTRGARSSRNRAITICDACYENGYFCCLSCSDYFHRDNCYDGEYCESCYESILEEDAEEEEEDSRYIHSYSQRINAPFLRTNVDANFEETPREERAKTLFMGVELEVESTDRNTNTDAETCTELFPRYNYQPLTLLKEDGSLSNGFEIVSCPATLDAHKKMWEKFFAERQKTTSLKSHDTKTCGLHVHVSRAPLSAMQIAKVVLFVNSAQNTPFIEALARRSHASYAKIKPKQVKDIFNRVDGILSNPDRYEAVNLQNDATIEFRLFKGTLKPATFFRTLEFCEALVLFCAPAETGLTDALHWEKFSAWLNDDTARATRYAELVKWIANYSNETKPE